MLSQTARVYELKNGLVLNGTVIHGDVETPIKYGFKTFNKNKTTLIHGYMGTQNVTEIETVRPVTVAIGDKVILADGTKGKVGYVAVELIEEKQLRFVTYERADKRTRITVEFI